jgi:hypothetical protein
MCKTWGRIRQVRMLIGIVLCNPDLDQDRHQNGNSDLDRQGIVPMPVRNTVFIFPVITITAHNFLKLCPRLFL